MAPELKRWTNEKALLENPSKDAKLSVYEPWPTAC